MNSAELQGADASPDGTRKYEPESDQPDGETGAEGDKRIEAAAVAGHSVVSKTIVSPTEVGSDNYRG